MPPVSVGEEPSPLVTGSSFTPSPTFGRKKKKIQWFLDITWVTARKIPFAANILVDGPAKVLTTQRAGTKRQV